MNSSHCPFKKVTASITSSSDLESVAGGPVAVVGPDARCTGVRDAGWRIPVK